MFKLNNEFFTRYFFRFSYYSSLNNKEFLVLNGTRQKVFLHIRTSVSLQMGTNLLLSWQVTTLMSIILMVGLVSVINCLLDDLLISYPGPLKIGFDF